MILAKDSYTIAAFLIVCYIAVVSDKFQKTLSLEKKCDICSCSMLATFETKNEEISYVL